MSIYSTNRLNNLSINDSDVSVNEDNSVGISDTNTVSDLNEEVSINLDDYINESSVDTYEAMSNITENDNNLFERLLKSDFMNICEKHTMNEDASDLDIEKTKQNMIRNEINKLYENTISSISLESKNLIDKVESFLESDKNTFEKYSKYLHESLVNNDWGIYNLFFACFEQTELLSDIFTMHDIAKVQEHAINSINKSDTKKIRAFVEAYLESIDNESKSCREAINNINEQYDNSDSITTESILEIVRDCHSDKTYFSDTIKTYSNIMIENLNIMHENTYKDNSATNVFSESVSETDSAKCYGIYEISSAICKEALERFNIFKNLFIEDAATIRKSTIIYGQIGEATIKGYSIPNHKINAISESVDVYVSDIFNGNNFVEESKLVSNAIMENHNSLMYDIGCQELAIYQETGENVKYTDNNVANTLKNNIIATHESNLEILKEFYRNARENTFYNLFESAANVFINMDNISDKKNICKVHEFFDFDNINFGENAKKYIKDICESKDVNVFEAISGLKVNSLEEMTSALKKELTGSCIEVDKSFLESNYENIIDMYDYDKAHDNINTIYGESFCPVEEYINYIKEADETFLNNINDINKKVSIAESVMTNCYAAVLDTYNRMINEYQNIAIKCNAEILDEISIIKSRKMKLAYRKKKIKGDDISEKLKANKNQLKIANKKELLKKKLMKQ